MFQFVLRDHRQVAVGPHIPTAHRIIRSTLFEVLTAPIIYSVLVPFVVLDLIVTVYQAACFPVYGIEKVRRCDHFIFDRARLPYLDTVDKLNCFYCSYANGLIAYVREIAGRTEEYWCGIKHAKYLRDPHERYERFAPYGDARAYRTQHDRLRDPR